MPEGAFEPLQKMFTPYADKTMLQVMSEDGPLKNGEMGNGVKFDVLWKKINMAQPGTAEQSNGTFGMRSRFIPENLELPEINLPLPFGKDE